MLAKVLPVIESADAAFFASIELTNSKMVTALQMLAHANFSKHDGESCCFSEEVFRIKTEFVKATTV